MNPPSTFYPNAAEADMALKSDISLDNFFVFNSSFGPREGEEEKKILYYYPPDVDIDTKIRNIGLVEAISKFTDTFSDKPCQALHTQKRRQVYYVPEKNFWMGMTVTIPSLQKVKDGQPFIEYHEEDVQDSVYEAVLKVAYKMFKLFMGTFYSILEKGSVHSLKQRLDHFYSRYLLTLKLNACDILDVFNGIHFLPLDKNTYLRIQCFVNLLEATFPSIKYTTFLYSDQLVWSGLEQEDMRVMYKYLITSLFPSYLEQEMHVAGSASPPTGVTPTSGAHYGKYITGPPNLADCTNLGKVPRVYVNTEVSMEECHLVVYRALSATVCMLVDSSCPLTFDLFKNWDEFVGPRLSLLASDISDNYTKRQANSPSEPVYKFIYFNHMNLAQKTTVHSEGRKSANICIPADSLKLLNDINSDLNRRSGHGETVIKMGTDYWAVGKKSDYREFYVVMVNKNTNLTAINDEVKKLCNAHFSSIFFLD